MVRRMRFFRIFAFGKREKLESGAVRRFGKDGKSESGTVRRLGKD